MKRIAITPGDRFGQLVVIQESDIAKTPSGRSYRQFECRCDCGRSATVALANLRSGHTASCGCLKRQPSPIRTTVSPGSRFGKLEVVEEAPSHRSPSGQIRRKIRCRCDCGSEMAVWLQHLISGHTLSCGCHKSLTLSKVRRTHGMSASRTYASWVDMKTRCTNPRSTSYRYYGARGISVCQRWMESFEAFLTDMGECTDGMTLDRIDVEGNYCPENCRWTSMTQQARNRRKNRLITHGGRTQCVAAWSGETGLARSTIINRLRLGYSVEEALTLLPRERRHRRP